MSSTHQSSARAILYAFLANLGIAISKLAAAVYTNSGSMLAEAIHSFADCGNQILLYIGLRSADREPDNEHPMGYGKLSYFWSFIVAIMLFSMGGLFSIYEGIHKLQGDAEVSGVWVALLVLGGAILLELASLWGALREIKTIRGDKKLFTWLKQTRNAELVVVLGEDTAAIVGLLIAFFFVYLTMITGDPFFDAIGSICIGGVLIFVALFIGIRIQSLLVGRSAEPDLQALIEKTITEHENIEEVLNAITLQFGPKVMLAAKIRMKGGISIDQTVAGINALERSIRKKFPEVGWCFVEPDNEN
jgi:cation diffusion facilitator family transporter